MVAGKQQYKYLSQVVAKKEQNVIYKAISIAFSPAVYCHGGLFSPIRTIVLYIQSR